MNSSRSLCRADLDALIELSGAVTYGVARACEVDPQEWERYCRWIAACRHGSMAYLEKYPDIRRDPRLLLDGAASIISFAFACSATKKATESSPAIAGYALGSDYHEVIRKRLSAVAEAMSEAYGCSCRVCVDTAPILERYWAEKAGVGFRGLHSQLIIPGKGAGFLLGEIITTLEIEPDEPCRLTCGSCGLCIAACPGKAIDGSGDIDARRCISYLTIESRDAIPEGTDTAGSVYGCDICRNVCPHQSHTASDVIPELTPRPEIMALTAAEILAMSQERFSKIFTHSAIKRTKLAGLLRNVKYLLKIND